MFIKFISIWRLYKFTERKLKKNRKLEHISLIQTKETGTTLSNLVPLNFGMQGFEIVP